MRTVFEKKMICLYTIDLTNSKSINWLVANMFVPLWAYHPFTRQSTSTVGVLAILDMVETVYTFFSEL